MNELTKQKRTLWDQEWRIRHVYTFSLDELRSQAYRDANDAWRRSGHGKNYEPLSYDVATLAELHRLDVLAYAAHRALDTWVIDTRSKAYRPVP